MARAPEDGRAAVRGAEALAHADALYDLAHHLTRDATEAEDLVQETFARALRAWDQFGYGASRKAWLFRILRNAWYDQVRRRRKAPAAGALEAGEDPPPDAAEADSWLRGDLELERMRRLVGGEIERALASLSEEARTAVLLDLEGLTLAEIALVLECAEGTVKSRLWRAREALRRRLAEYRR